VSILPLTRKGGNAAGLRLTRVRSLLLVGEALGFGDLLGPCTPSRGR
jgi:hypothetical protein